MKLKLGMHVKVTEERCEDLDSNHPQAGVTGIITEFMGVVTAWGKPRAMIKRDDGTGFIIVSLKYLESD